MVDSKIDLEVNEMRCFDSIRVPTLGYVFSSHTPRLLFISNFEIPLLWYTDHTPTAHILIKALVRLSHLDNLETMILERVEGG